jgi:hypothetical protein
MLDKYNGRIDMEIEIESYPVADLPSRYQLGKQQVYNRFVALGIRPSKVGKRAYIANAQLQLLDRLHAHINGGGLMADFDFPNQSDAEISPVDAIDKTNGHSISNKNSLETSTLDTIDTTSGQIISPQISPLDTIDTTSGLGGNNVEVLVNLIAGAVSQTIASTVQQRSPLWYMSELEQAEAQGWMLTTAEIQQLIGVKPTAAKGTSIYQRGSFAFVKAGKIGSQTAWRVTKHLD